MVKRLKCRKCKEIVHRAYIRKNIDKKRSWITIGYYCFNCGLIKNKNISKKLYRDD